MRKDRSDTAQRTHVAVFYLYASAALLLAIATAIVYVQRGPIHNLFELPFYVGETSWNLISGNGLSCVNYPIPGTGMVLRAARMPVATLYVSAAILYLGPMQVLGATVIKAVLLLLPVLRAARMVLYRCTTSKRLLFACAAWLTVPFLVPNFLADIVNLQVEEGFSYAFLVISFTLVALGPRGRAEASNRKVWIYTVATAAALDLLYLSKSSMILAVVALLLFSLVRNGPAWSRVVLLLLVVFAPLGWAVRQHAVSGRYAVGTSWDGGNFHKGNNEHFLSHYPPVGAANLDNFDHEIAPSHNLGDEWAYNDWHSHEAIQFIHRYPRATLVGLEKKVYVFLLSPRVYGNGQVETASFLTWTGMILFRLMLFSAIGLSLNAAVRGKGSRREFGILYLMMLVAVATPYLVGFGYTRHASVLIYPSAVAICLLCQPWFRCEKGLFAQPNPLL